MNDFDRIIHDKTPVLVNCLSLGCSHCRPVTEILKEVKAQLGMSVRIVKVDIDENPAFTQKWHVQGVPMLILFKEGKMVWRHAGALPTSTLVEKIKPHII